MKRTEVTGSTVRDYRDKVQMALFDDNNQYAGLFILEYDEAAKLARKLLRKAQHRVVQDVDKPSSSGLDATARLTDAEGEALPPGGYAHGTGAFSTDAVISSGLTPREADLIDTVARAHDEGTPLASVLCTCPEGRSYRHRVECPVYKQFWGID